MIIRPSLPNLALSACLAIAGCTQAPIEDGRGPRTEALKAGLAYDRTEVGFSLSTDIQGGSATDWDREFDILKNSSAKWVRVTFGWETIQAGGVNSFNWYSADKYVSEANARGIKVIACIDGSPAWANGGHSDRAYPPNDTVKFKTFAKKVAQRYIPQGVLTYELWNEPNLEGHFRPAANPALYVSRILIPGFNGIREAALDDGALATVLTGGTSPAADRVDLGRMKPVTFIAGIYDAGGKNYFNGVAHHPYSGNLIPSSTDPTNAMMQTDDIFFVMGANGDSAKKIWATEFGYRSGLSQYEWAYTEDGQADRLEQALDQWFSWSFTGPAMIFEAKNNGPIASDPQQNFGLFYNDFRPKKAYQRLRELIAPPVTTDGCTSQQRNDSLAFGCGCQNGSASCGSALGSDACTPLERSQANFWGCDCAIGVPIAGNCPAYEQNTSCDKSHILGCAFQSKGCSRNLCTN